MYDSSTQRLADYKEELRRLKLRQGGTESHTFIVGGDWDSTLYIPPLIVFGAGKALLDWKWWASSGNPTPVTWAAWDVNTGSDPGGGVAMGDLGTFSADYSALRPVVGGSGSDLSIGVLIG